MNDLVLKAEPLDAELEACRMRLGSFEWIKHPLVNSLAHPPEWNCILNRQLREKREAIARAVAERRWDTVIALHERPWRFDALMGLAPLLSDARYFKLLGDVWTDSENVWQYKRQMRRLFWPRGRDLRLRPLLMGGHDRRIWKRLPDLTVYRGCGPLNKQGWSWTFHPSNAAWFATRRGGGLVLRGLVAKADVIAYFTTRNEEEVVCDPARVEVVETRRMS